MFGMAAPRCIHARTEGGVFPLAASRIDIGRIDASVILAKSGHEATPGRLAGPCLFEDLARCDRHEEEARTAHEKDRRVIIEAYLGGRNAERGRDIGLKRAVGHFLRHHRRLEYAMR